MVQGFRMQNLADEYKTTFQGNGPVQKRSPYIRVAFKSFLNVSKAEMK